MTDGKYQRTFLLEQQYQQYHPIAKTKIRNCVYLTDKND